MYQYDQPQVCSPAFCYRNLKFSCLLSNLLRPPLQTERRKSKEEGRKLTKTWKNPRDGGKSQPPSSLVNHLYILHWASFEFTSKNNDFLSASSLSTVAILFYTVLHCPCFFSQRNKTQRNQSVGGKGSGMERTRRRPPRWRRGGPRSVLIPRWEDELVIFAVWCCHMVILWF